MPRWRLAKRGFCLVFLDLLSLDFDRSSNYVTKMSVDCISLGLNLIHQHPGHTTPHLPIYLLKWGAGAIAWNTRIHG